MTQQERLALLSGFMANVQHHLVSKSDGWPDDWDGHEIRELVYRAFEFERTSLMRERYSRRRRRFNREVIVRNLY